MGSTDEHENTVNRGNKTKSSNSWSAGCVCAFLENKPQIAGLGNVVLRAPHSAYTFFDRPFRFVIH